MHVKGNKKRRAWLWGFWPAYREVELQLPLTEGVNHVEARWSSAMEVLRLGACVIAKWRYQVGGWMYECGLFHIRGQKEEELNERLRGGQWGHRKARWLPWPGGQVMSDGVVARRWRLRLAGGVSNSKVSESEWSPTWVRLERKWECVLQWVNG